MEGPELGLGGEEITWPDQVAPRGRKASSTRKIKRQTSNLFFLTVSLEVLHTSNRLTAAVVRQREDVPPVPECRVLQEKTVSWSARGLRHCNRAIHKYIGTTYPDDLVDVWIWWSNHHYQTRGGYGSHTSPGHTGSSPCQGHPNLHRAPGMEHGPLHN